MQRGQEGQAGRASALLTPEQAPLAFDTELQLRGILVPHPNMCKTHVTFNSGGTKAELLNGKLRTPRTCMFGLQKAKITVGLGEDLKARVFQVRDFLYLLYPARE